MSASQTYRISYFGVLAERRGLREEWIACTGATPAAVYAELTAIHDLGMSAGQLRVAVNDEFSSWQHALQPGDTLAFLPPMSGG